jgi:hypothetical protein
MMPTKSHSARNGREPRLNCAPEGIREDDLRIETPAHLLRNRQNRVLRRKGDDFVDLGNRFPECFKLRWSENGEPGIRATMLERACRALAHDRVAQPVRGANEKTEGKQFGRVGPCRQKNPRFCFAMRRCGQGVFQRLCTQNQSAGDRRIWRSRAALISAVSCSGLLESYGSSSSKTTRHLAKPEV